MKTKTKLLFLTTILYSKLFSQDFEKPKNVYISPDKKYIAETYYSDLDPECKKQPGAIFDLPESERYCKFLIKNNIENRIEYELKAGDFSKEIKKCYPLNFELGIAYGFGFWTEDNKIVYTKHSGWFSANDLYLETFKFDWKKCTNEFLGSFQSYPLDYDEYIGTIYFASSTKYHYIFFQDSQRKKGFIGKINNNKDIDINEIFNFNKRYKKRLKDNVTILYEINSQHLSYSYSYPIAIAKFSNSRIKINLSSNEINVD
ncbi:hypothetical protein [Leptospira limi]|uniref:WG repeat-containing protein n=1 Tax=Leptospira limi TaxID=2950023 RepID=A0ABT3LZH1_9LEPT|nr:hypothetical protein [Leptospira limi]MCW7463121.1 hypothetical protein [Leptospira limi]